MYQAPMTADAEPTKYSPRFFRHLAVNLVTSIALTWLWVPFAASLFDFIPYVKVNDLWACQAVTGIEAVLISTVFHLNRKALWPWFLGAIGVPWGIQALYVFICSPEAKGLTNVLLVFAIPSIQLLVASIQAESWRAFLPGSKNLRQEGDVVYPFESDQRREVNAEQPNNSQRFSWHLAANLLTSIALTWVLFPFAASLFDFKWYGVAAAENVQVNDLWFCQVVTGVASVLITILFRLANKESWHWFLGVMGVVWGFPTLAEYISGPVSTRATNVLLMLAIPTTQLLVASIISGSWRKWAAANGAQQ